MFEKVWLCKSNSDTKFSGSNTSYQPQTLGDQDRYTADPNEDDRTHFQQDGGRGLGGEGKEKRKKERRRERKKRTKKRQSRARVKREKGNAGAELFSISSRHPSLGHYTKPCCICVHVYSCIQIVSKNGTTSK